MGLGGFVVVSLHGDQNCPIATPGRYSIMPLRAPPPMVKNRNDDRKKHRVINLSFHSSVEKSWCFSWYQNRFKKHESSKYKACKAQFDSCHRYRISVFLGSD